MKLLLQLALIIVFGANIDAFAQRRPLLFPNPTEPGKHPLTELKVQMREKFDTNHDGFLNSEERNAMRLATKQAANARMEAFLAAQRQRQSNNQPPERWLKLYDINRDKRLNSTEWNVARTKESNRVIGIFDKDKNNAIDDREKQAIIAFLKGGKHNGYDAYILRLVSGLESRGNSQEGSPSSRYKRFDFDQDGIASQAELDAIRASEATSRKETSEQ